MRIVTSILAAIGVIGIIIFLILMSGLLLYSLTPSQKSHMADVQVSAEAVESFDQKLDTFKDEVKAAAESQQSKQIRLVITEEEVNSKIVELLAEDKLPVKELRINFNEDIGWVYTELNNPGINAKIGIIASVEAVDGEVKVDVLDFHLGKLLLPDSANEWLASLLEILAKTQDPFGDLPAVTLNAIEIDDDELIWEMQTISAEQ